MVARGRAPKRWAAPLIVLLIAVSVATLGVAGYRAVNGWRDSAMLVAERHAATSSDLLVRAITDDMRSVQSSVLPALSQTDSSDLNDRIVSAFARYPYPEAFFVWSSPSPPDSLNFFARSDRYPSWMPPPREPRRLPVVQAAAPRVATLLVQRIDHAAVNKLRTSVFHAPIDGSNYQVVVALSYHNAFRERVQTVVGFMVNLSWVRQHYFQELVTQVTHIDGTNSGVAFSILDADGNRVLGPPPADEPTSRLLFPLVFAEPSFPSMSEAGGPEWETWTAAASAANDPTLMAANRSATQTLSVATITIVVLGVGALLALRAAKANVELANLRSDFVSTLTHELKTPIATIRAINETLASGRNTAPGATQKYARMALNETKRLARLIENLLAYSRVTDVTEVYTFEPLSPAQLVEEALRDFQSLLTEEGFDVHVDVPADTPEIYADRTAVTLMLSNLIDNAVRYSGDARCLWIRVHHQGASVVFSVTDQGVGIPKKDLPHVTRKFFRGHHMSPGGSGLGLSIVQRVVSDHQGTLDIRSDAGSGTTVSVTLLAVQPGGSS